MSPSDAHKEAVPASERRSLPDFPHGPHVPLEGKPAHPRLANGCFTCHEFVESSDGIRAHAVVETLPEARDCRTCHAQHDEVGGGACGKCHAQEPGSFHSFWGEQPPADRPPPTRPWPGFGDFDHSSRGHVAIASPTSEQRDCMRCHASVEQTPGDAQLLRASETLATVPIPSEAQAVCRECHVNPRTLRFHWR
jgi:hypothetical protein